MRQRYDSSLGPTADCHLSAPADQADGDADQGNHEIHRAFPSQTDNFERLLQRIVDYDDLDQRRRWIRALAWIIPLAWTILGLTFKAPVAMVAAGLNLVARS